MYSKLLADKYAPNSLDDIQHNDEAVKMLKNLAGKANIPHLIVKGERGTGKKTLLKLFLQEKYGNYTTYNTSMMFKIPGKTDGKTMNLLASKYHYQFNPNVHNTYDRTLLKLFINEISYRSISGLSYRIVIIEDADLLTVEAQESLRKTLETYIHICRFIFICNNEGRIIDPIYSRCAVISVNAPTVDEIINILTPVVEQEETSDVDVVEIANASRRNLRVAFQLLEKKILGFDNIFYDPIHKLCDDIVQILIKGTIIADMMDSVRQIIYKIVNHRIDTNIIIYDLLSSLLDKLPKKAHNERYLLCLKASEIDESIRQSSKSIYHIEGFCLYAMSVIKSLTTTKKRQPKIQVRKT